MADDAISEIRSRRVVSLAGAFLVAAGLMAIVFPLVSVWWVTGEVFTELPASVPGSSIDDRNRLALTDRDFVLGTRSYEATSVSEVEVALRDDGFESFALDGETWFAKPCCGGYDAVWVRVAEADDTTIASISVADGDVKAIWPMAGVVGLLVVALGIAVRRLAPGVGYRNGSRIPVSIWRSDSSSS